MNKSSGTISRKKSRWGPELPSESTQNELQSSPTETHKPHEYHTKPIVSEQRDKLFQGKNKMDTSYEPLHQDTEKSRPTLMSNFSRSPTHLRHEYQPLHPRPPLNPFSIDMFDNYEIPTIIDSFEQNDSKQPKTNLSDSLLYEMNQQIRESEQLDLVNKKQQLVSEIESLDDEISRIEAELSSKNEISTTNSVFWPLYRVSIDKKFICDVYKQCRSKHDQTEQFKVLNTIKLKEENESNIIATLPKIFKALQSNKLYRHRLSAVYELEYRKMLFNWNSHTQVNSSEKVIVEHSPMVNPVIRSEEAYNQILLDLLRSERNDPSTRWMSTLAKPSPMIIPYSTMDRFIDSNSRNPHPMITMKASSQLQDIVSGMERFASYSLSTGIRPFTKSEVNIFMEKYLLYPKRWDIIAKSLHGRSYNEIIQYYYENKKRLEFKKWLRVPGQKKKTTMIGNVLTNGKVMFRHAISETMLDMIHQDEQKAIEQEKSVAKRPGRPRKYPVVNKIVENSVEKRKRTRENTSNSDDIVVIPSIAIENKGKLHYNGFPLDFSDGSSNGVVFWLPIERSFLVDCYRKYGNDWKKIATEFELFRNERMGNKSCGRRLVQKDHTLTCLERALKEETDIKREKMYCKLDSEDAIKLFFELYKSCYRMEGMDFSASTKKMAIKTKPITTISSMSVNPVNSVVSIEEKKASISDLETDALTYLESLASVAQEESMMLQRTVQDYSE